MKWKNIFGPSTLVAAAFIGPGTLTVCSIAGAKTGYQLLWVLVLSIVATICLQEMAARLGLISKQGLGEAIRSQLKNPVLRFIGILLTILAIVVGNGAYEAGNISGAVLGLEAALGAPQMAFHDTFLAVPHLYPLLISAIAFTLLFFGNFKWIQNGLVVLVLLMSLVFLVSAIALKPDLGQLLKGLIIPKMPAGQLLTIVGLLGTTVVPYNLFLQASAVGEKWNKAEDLPSLRIENAVAILIGGLISLCIVITSAAAFYGTADFIAKPTYITSQLEPILGAWSKYFLAMGFFAAGISSAITAPLAAAYTLNGLLNWKEDLKGWRFRLVWILILVLGTIFAPTGYSPIYIIQLAQFTNGLLLPLVAIFLLYIVNQGGLMGKYTNSVFQNVLGFIVVLVTLVLGIKSLITLFG